jgi:hypothetical protein
MRNKFFKWCSSSLFGHLVLFELICATPLAVMFLFSMLSDGTLTIGRALYVFALCSVLFGIGAVLFWYTVSLPLIKSRRGRS